MEIRVFMKRTWKTIVMLIGDCIEKEERREEEKKFESGGEHYLQRTSIFLRQVVGNELFVIRSIVSTSIYCNRLSKTLREIILFVRQ